MEPWAFNAIGQMFFNPGLPVLVPDDHCCGRGGPVGTVRLRKPPEPHHLATRAAVPVLANRPISSGKPSTYGALWPGG